MDGTTPCRGRRAVDPAQSTPKGRFVLRADSIRPYNCGGRAADGSTASRPLQFHAGKLIPSNVSLYPVSVRADSIRPYGLGEEALPFNTPLYSHKLRADAIRPPERRKSYAIHLPRLRGASL